MNSADRGSPLAASNVRFPRPKKSFISPRTLATKDLYTTVKSAQADDCEIEFEEAEITDDTSQEDIVTSLLLASAKATNKISDAVTDQTEVEKGAPHLIDITTAGWIAFDHHHQAYLHNGGKKKIVKLIDKDNLAYIAEYILEDSINVLVTMDDEDIREMFNRHLSVAEATSYSKELQKLYMPRSMIFDRDAIQKYISVFLKTLQKNENFLNPSKGGTTAKKINEMMMTGIQPPDFAAEIRRYGTETVKDTNTAIRTELPLFMAMVNKGGYKSTVTVHEKNVTKSPSQWNGLKNSSVAGVRKCQHCEQPGHGWEECPFKAECLRCKTKDHAYWNWKLCSYRQAKQDRKEQKKPQAKALAAIVAAPAQAPAPASPDYATMMTAIAALAAELKELKVTRKKKILDSGANTSIISDISHLDPNTPFCRAKEPHGVETANHSVMEISGSGRISDLDGVICDGAICSLISVPQLCKDKKAAVIFDDTGAVAVKLDTQGVLTLNGFKDECFKNNQYLLTAHINKDSLYELDEPHVSVLPSVVSSVPCETSHWTPNEKVLEQHGIAVEACEFGSKHFAGGAFYYTAECQSVRDMVRFFHEAWDHPSRDLMCKIVDQQMLANIPKELTAKTIRKHFPQCEACPAGNMAQQPIPRDASDRVFIPGEEFQVDIKVWANGSKALKHRRAFGRHIGALTAIDLATRYKIGKPIKSTGALEVELETLRVEIHGTGHTLRVLRLDNQFVTASVRRWAALCEPPIELQPCIPHEHHSIGDIERFHRTLEDAVFKKMYGKRHLTVQYWAMAYTDYIMKSNMMGSVHGPKESPYELWTGKHPDVLKLPMIPFGSVVMAHVPLDQQTTDGPRSILHYAVGTSLGHQGGLRLFNPATKKVVVRATYKVLGPEPQPYTRPEYEIDADGDVTVTSVYVDTSEVSGNVSDYQYLVGTIHKDKDDQELYKTMSVVEETFDIKEGSVIVAYRRHVSATGKMLPKTEDDDFAYHIQDIVQDTADYALESTNKVSKKTSQKIACHTLAFGATSTPVKADHKLKIDWSRRLPRTIADVLSMPTSNPDRAGFLASTAAEIKSLHDMGTWDMNEILHEEQMRKSKIGMSKIVFTKKYHPDGTFDKHKSRIVFRGDRWYDLYDNKTYAGTVMSETVRAMLSVAATEDMELGCLDVKTAFLYGAVPEDQFIYMRRPAGLTDTDMPAVIRLRKCIYGLAHAPATFRKHSDDVLRRQGLIPTVSDPRLYVRLHDDGTKVYVAVHVDDFGIAASTKELMESTMTAIKAVYHCTESDLGFYLGLKLVRDRVRRTITISQPGYLDDLREEYGITSTGGPMTPMIDKPREPESENNPALDKTGIQLYQSKVGAILWSAMGSRPEVQFATNTHARYTKSPLRGDMITLDRVLEYLVHTPELGLVLGGHGGIKLYATVDASYGTHTDRKSHTGCTLHIGEGSGAFLARSKKQTVTADSSTVAEFIATHLAAKEIMWARTLLEEMGYPQLAPTVLGEDNMSTIAMINNDCNGQKTKHIEIRFNLIREQVKKLIIELKYLKTQDMTSDILTKPLDPKPFLHLRSKLLGMMAWTPEGVYI